MERDNAPDHGLRSGDSSDDLPILAERGELGHQASTTPLDLDKIHDEKKRDTVLVVGNIASIINSSVALVFTLLEQHYALTHGFHYEPSGWQLGLIFGPIVGYNFWAWFLRFLRGHQ